MDLLKNAPKPPPIKVIRVSNIEELEDKINKLKIRLHDKKLEVERIEKEIKAFERIQKGSVKFYRGALVK